MTPPPASSPPSPPHLNIDRPFIYAINCGGPKLVDAYGQVWSGDADNASLVSGGAYSATSDTFTGAEDPSQIRLYQSQRYGQAFRYSLPIQSPGSYGISLLFGEFYWAEAGKRVFSVSVEGVEILKDFDIYTECGGRYAACTRSFPVTVSDGVLDIDFATTVDNAQISAIAVFTTDARPPPPPGPPPSPPPPPPPPSPPPSPSPPPPPPSPPELSPGMEPTWDSLPPISLDPPFNFASSSKPHPSPPKRLSPSLNNTPIPTNKFWTNLVVGEGYAPVHTHPYVVAVVKDAPYGFAVSHPMNRELGVGSGTPDRVQFYFNVLLRNIQLSAAEWANAEPPRQVNSFDDLSATLCIGYGCNSTTTNATTTNNNTTTNIGTIVAPLVRGMAYVTAMYSNLTPVIATQHAIVDINGAGVPAAGVNASRFEITLNNGQTWLAYFLSSPVTLTPSSTQLTTSTPYTGTLRLALKPPSPGTDACSGDVRVLDESVGRVVVGGSVEHALSYGPSEGYYGMRWKSVGDERVPLLHFTLAHQRDSMGEGFAAPVNLTMMSTTKGRMVAYVGSTWVFKESLPSITWMPPSPPNATRVAAITAQLPIDAAADVAASTGGASNYFAGKSLFGYAMLCQVIERLSGPQLLQSCVSKLQAALSVYYNNTQENYLLYDTAWKGLAPQAGFVPQSDSQWLADFGSSYYSDHHYHWGYLLQSAARLLRLLGSNADPTTLASVRAWGDALVRDAGNPYGGDPYFPRFRGYDWFAGHSWSAGVFEGFDGKDQESWSEDINFSHGIQLWGQVTGRPWLERVGAMMVAVGVRAAQRYNLMLDGSDIHPPEFVGNKVTGIFFENKCDYTTWFGNQPQYIHGIQMIPMAPVMEVLRLPKFVREEWEQRLVNATISAEWKSLLYANLAIIDPATAFGVLQDELTVMDGSMTRSWALYWAATRPNQTQS